MRDKLLQIRVDEEFLSKIEYLKEINGFKNIAETVRKIIEKEYRKEHPKVLKLGEWEKSKFGVYICSICGEVVDEQTLFCPNCKREMKL